MAIVVLSAVVVLVGGLGWPGCVRPLLPSGSAVTDGLRLYAARMETLPLGVALLVLLATRSWRLLGWLPVLVSATDNGGCISALTNRD